jgi:hypothetical protein
MCIFLYQNPLTVKQFHVFDHKKPCYYSSGVRWFSHALTPDAGLLCPESHCRMPPEEYAALLHPGGFRTPGKPKVEGRLAAYFAEHRPRAAASALTTGNDWIRALEFVPSPFHEAHQ